MCIHAVNGVCIHAVANWIMVCVHTRYSVCIHAAGLHILLGMVGVLKSQLTHVSLGMVGVQAQSETYKKQQKKQTWTDMNGH